MARTSLFRRFTDTNVYETGPINIGYVKDPWIFGYFYSVIQQVGLLSEVNPDGTGRTVNEKM